MKRFLSFMMALALLFSMSVNAFAAEGEEGEVTPNYETGTGSITITNATVDDVYSIYKIFDATYNADANGNTNAVSYSITKSNQFFKVMFGEDGKTENPYFTYNATTGAVIRKDGTKDSDIVDYLKGIIKTEGANYTAATEPIKATGQEVKFENIPYGYYIIAKANGAAVTIDSNTPNVEVIDKNQKPTGLTKWIWDEDLVENGVVTGGWVKDTSANVGDREKFELRFIATNYFEDKAIKYYTVFDEYDNALQIDFNSFTVKVGTTTLTKGYYCDVNDQSQNKKLGTAWTEEEAADAAEYYIIRTGNNSFEVVIPWMTNQTFEVTGNKFVMKDVQNSATAATSKYPATTDVYINYEGIVENDAMIGGGSGEASNLKNHADITWTHTGGTVDGNHDDTNIRVYALGLNKVDAATKAPLAGAEFEVYRNENGKETPVNVSTTNETNVYIYNAASGNNKVVTDTAGKIVIIGLEQGTYYLKEVKAPDGYNVLAGKDTSVGVGKVEGEGAVEKPGAVVDFFTYSANSVTVENSKGIELPSTGGEGTMRMITIGSIVAIAFAVLLITNKKMSVYQD